MKDVREAASDVAGDLSRFLRAVPVQRPKRGPRMVLLGDGESDVLGGAGLMGVHAPRANGSCIAVWIALACAGCQSRPPTPPPKPPTVGTVEGRQCVQTCQAIEALCLAGTNQAPINAVGSTPGGVLLSIIANASAQERGREACEAILARCYPGCADTVVSAEQAMQAEMRAQVCGPLCADGSPAIWTGFAAAVGGQGFVKAVVSMCFDSEGHVLRGGWSCTPGSVNCVAAGGTLEGRLVGTDLNASGAVDGRPDVLGTFRGRLTGAGLQGGYVLRASSGDQATGLWSVEHCPLGH